MPVSDADVTGSVTSRASRADYSRCGRSLLEIADEATLATHCRSSAIGRWEWQDEEDRQGRQDLEHPWVWRDLGARFNLAATNEIWNRRYQHDRRGRAAR